MAKWKTWISEINQKKKKWMSWYLPANVWGDRKSLKCKPIKSSELINNCTIQLFFSKNDTSHRMINDNYRLPTLIVLLLRVGWNVITTAVFDINHPNSITLSTRCKSGFHETVFKAYFNFKAPNQVMNTLM